MKFGITSIRKRHIKELLCQHKWEYMSKPNDNKASVKCIKCDKIDNRKINKLDVVARTYCWCPDCGNNLVRDSFVSDDGVVEYRCTNCGELSIWSFIIAPLPICLSE